MKITFSLLLALVICMPFANQAQTAKSRLAFEKIQHNFGTFKEELGVQTVAFNFKNDGTSAINPKQRAGIVRMYYS